MSWHSSNRRAELPPDWDAIAGKFKRQRKKIDGGRCQKRLPSGKRCPRPGTDADHIDDPNNHKRLQLLCEDHHKQKTQGEAQAPRREIKRLKNRPAEPHPGDLR